MRGNFIYKRFGERIISQRKKRGLSQEDLSILSDVDRTYVGKIEQGKANPTFKIIVKLSKALKIKPLELFEGV